ncbi:MAG TPA: cyclic nucleotide-binding domain-containing protein [Fimbriimonas sp.]
MDAKHLDFIVGCASNVVFQSGDFLFKAGAPADQFYLLRYGTVALQVYAPGQGATVVDTLEEGEVVGWSWLVEPHRARFDAIARQTVRAICLDGECIRRKCESDHELGYQMLMRVVQVMDQRIHATRIQLLDLYGANL